MRRLRGLGVASAFYILFSRRAYPAPHKKDFLTWIVRLEIR
jgi:hypothetical protein